MDFEKCYDLSDGLRLKHLVDSISRLEISNSHDICGKRRVATAFGSSCERLFTY